MKTNSYINKSFGVVHRVEFICTSGHTILQSVKTIWWDQIVWG